MVGKKGVPSVLPHVCAVGLVFSYINKALVGHLVASIAASSWLVHGSCCDEESVTGSAAISQYHACH